MMGVFDKRNFITNSDIGFTITQPAFDNLVLELNDYVDKLEAILRSIEMDVYNSQEYFKGEVGDTIRAKFREYSKQIDILSSSLLSYPNDLLKFKQSLKDNDTRMISVINDFTAGLKSKTTEVIEK